MSDVLAEFGATPGVDEIPDRPPYPPVTLPPATPFPPAGLAVLPLATAGSAFPHEEFPPSDDDVLRYLRSAYGPAGWAFLHTAEWWVALRGKTETVTARDPIRLRSELGPPPVDSSSLNVSSA